MKQKIYKKGAPWRTLMVILLSVMGIGQAWANTSHKSSLAGIVSDTSYIVTSNLSTKDTIYVKHEDTTASTTTFWDKYGNTITGILEALLALFSGIGVALYTTKKQEKKDKERLERELSNRLQTKIAEEGVAKEQDIYSYFVDIPDMFDDGKDIVPLLDEMARKLDRYKIDIRPVLYLDSLEWHAYWTNIVYGEGEVRDTSKEHQLMDHFYHLYKS